MKEAQEKGFQTYASQIIKNAKVLADELMNLGCKLVTNGTDNHLMVVDCVTSFGTNGKVIEKILDEVGITLNKNAIPNDTNPPFKPSGIRLGTPPSTTRGMKEKEMKSIAKWIVEASNKRKEKQSLEKIREEVRELCLQFPVPGIN